MDFSSKVLWGVGHIGEQYYRSSSCSTLHFHTFSRETFSIIILPMNHPSKGEQLPVHRSFNKTSFHEINNDNSSHNTNDWQTELFENVIIRCVRKFVSFYRYFHTDPYKEKTNDQGTIQRVQS